MAVTQKYSYDHTQSVASTTWNITHNLGYKPVIDVVITINGQLTKVLPKNIYHVDNSNLVVEFSQAFTGTARLV